MKRDLFKKIIRLYLLIAMTSLSLSCASNEITLETTPPGADIYASNGEKVGQTPVTFKGSEIDKITDGNRVYVHLSKEGYSSSELISNQSGLDKYNIKLKALDSNYFQQDVLSYYGKNYNLMIREILLVQGYIFSKQQSEAESRINDFVKKYPNVAAGYVLKANLEAQAGKPDEARQYLLRAKQLDPNDPVVQRLLGDVREPSGGSK